MSFTVQEDIAQYVYTHTLLFTSTSPLSILADSFALDRDILTITSTSQRVTKHTRLELNP